MSRFGGVPVDQPAQSGSRFGGVAVESAPSIPTGSPPTAPQGGEYDQSPIIQVGSGVLEGLAGLPGLPVQLASWAKGVPLEGSNLEGWGVTGWQDFAERNFGKIRAPAPTTELGQSARKFGNFMGGGVVGGPAAMVPSLTSFVGSEVGRKTDEAGLTGGYGETVGAFAGAVAPAMVRGQTTAGIKPQSAPTNEQLKSAANAAYKEADNAGVVVNSTGVDRLSQAVKTDLADLAFTPALQPRIAAALKEIDNTVQGGNVTLKGLDTLRKIARNAYTGTMDATEKMMASKLIEHIDDFIDDVKPSELVTGDPTRAAAALKEARALWTRLKKSELVDEALNNADLRAGSTHAGANIDNAIRQNIRALLTNKKLKGNKTFTQAERNMMERFVRGGSGQNLLRWLGRSSPESGGLGTYLGLGAAATAPGGWMLPAAGFVSKRVSDALTKRNATILSETIRRGTPPVQPQTVGQRVNALTAEATRRGGIAAQDLKRAAPAAVYAQPQSRLQMYRQQDE
jgi:hypothetical protein